MKKTKISSFNKVKQLMRRLVRPLFVYNLRSFTALVTLLSEVLVGSPLLSVDSSSRLTTNEGLSTPCGTGVTSPLFLILLPFGLFPFLSLGPENIK